MPDTIQSVYLGISLVIIFFVHFVWGPKADNCFLHRKNIAGFATLGMGWAGLFVSAATIANVLKNISPF